MSNGNAKPPLANRRRIAIPSRIWRSIYTLLQTPFASRVWLFCKGWIQNEILSPLLPLGGSLPNMEPQQTTFTREQFYDLIWKTPLSHLSKSFAVPVHLLVKLCEEFDIPRPGPEYWPYLRLGYTVEKVPLPPAVAGIGMAIEVKYACRTRQAAPFVDPMAVEPSAAPAEPRQQPAIELADDFRKAHPLVRAARKLLEREARTENGLLRADYRKPCLNVNASRGGLRRALLVMDAIIQELDRRGYSTQIPEERHHTCVFIGEDRVSISISEKVDRRERELTAEEKKSSFVFNRHSWHPTGSLSFQILEYQHRGARKTWGDGKRQRLEEFLTVIVDAIIATGAALKEQRLIWEERRRQWAEEARAREEAQRRREQEAARQKALEEQATRLHSAERIREFVQVCRHSLAGRGVMEPDSPARRWLDWASLHADRIDPLRNGWIDEAVANLPSDTMRLIGNSTPSAS